MNAMREVKGKAGIDRRDRPEARRRRTRRGPSCELLEGRQLLSTTAGAVASSTPSWGSWRDSASTSAETAHFGDQGEHVDHAAWSGDVTHTGSTGTFKPKSIGTGEQAWAHHASA